MLRRETERKLLGRRVGDSYYERSERKLLILSRGRCLLRMGEPETAVVFDEQVNYKPKELI
jgi:hypothetical protein